MQITNDSDTDKLLGLRIAVASWAFMGLVGIPILVFFDVANAWRWSPYNEIYDQMIVSIYFALGLLLVPAILDPYKSWSLLRFVVLSSVIHGGDLTGFSWTRLIEIISVERKPEDAQEAT